MNQCCHFPLEMESDNLHLSLTQKEGKSDSATEETKIEKRATGQKYASKIIELEVWIQKELFKLK